MVFFRERYVDFFFFANLSADQLIFEARDEAAGTNLQRVILALAAFECFAIYETFEIKRREVAIFNFGTFRSVNHLALTILERLELLFNVFIRYSFYVLFHLQAFVFAEFNFRTRRNRSLEYEILAIFKGFDVDLRAANRLNLLFFKSISESLGAYDIECFLHDSIHAHVALDDLARSLALAETRNIYTVAKTLYSLFHCLGNFRSFNLHRQSNLLVFTIFNRNFHCLKRPPVII